MTNDTLLIMREYPLLRLLQSMFERWRRQYLHLATMITLLVASPLAVSSMATVAFRTNLSLYQIKLLTWTLLGVSVISGILVYTYTVFLSPYLRQALKTPPDEPLPASVRLRAWHEATYLPQRIIIAIGTTLFLTYIIPTILIMSTWGQATLEEIIYIALGQILAGVNLAISANLVYNLLLMPVYNALAPLQDDIALSQIASTTLNTNLIFQSVAITSIALLILAPHSYYQITKLASAAGFRVIDLGTVRRALFIITGTSLTFSFIYSALLGYIASLPGRVTVQAIARLQTKEHQVRIPVLSSNENGQIAIYLNRLLDQSQNLEDRLHTLVEERTISLRKRTEELQTIAEIAEQAARFESVSQLVEALVEIISQRFGFYHVGLFTIDTQNGYAVLQAANSSGGKRMLARNHKLRLGEGIVGTVAQQRSPRIALDVGADAVFFNNPDLPETRSEMALPLIARGRLIGVLDIQSRQANAFQPEDMETLQILANQTALAIENIRLLEESQQALQELQTFIQKDIRKHWAARLGHEKIAFTYTGLGITPRSSVTAEANGYVLRLPIKLQDIQLGQLQLRRADRPWTQSEKDMADSIGQQVALALESARLLEQTRQFVAREQTISSISNRMRQSLDLDAILRTTVHELQSRLGLTEAEIQIVPPNAAAQEEG